MKSVPTLRLVRSEPESESPRGQASAKDETPDSKKSPAQSHRLVSFLNAYADAIDAEIKTILDL